jgi:hypothetical protein
MRHIHDVINQPTVLNWKTDSIHTQSNSKWWYTHNDHQNTKLINLNPLTTTTTTTYYITRYDRVGAQLHFNKCKIIGVKSDTNTGMTMYHNQLKQGTKVKWPHYETNNCELTTLFPTINCTSLFVMINKEHACW